MPVFERGVRVVYIRECYACAFERCCSSDFLVISCGS